MRWMTPLYMGKTAEKERRKILRALRHGRRCRGTYVLALPANPQNQLDIFEADELQKDIYKRREPVIIGIAADRSEAFELLRQIAEETISSTGKADMRSYLVSRMTEASHG